MKHIKRIAALSALALTLFPSTMNAQETLPPDTTASTPLYLNSITFHPNPASDFIIVEGLKGSVLTIYDMKSSEVIIREHVLSNKETVSVERLSSGTYILSAENKSDNARYTAKLVIARWHPKD